MSRLMAEITLGGRDREADALSCLPWIDLMECSALITKIMIPTMMRIMSPIITMVITTVIGNINFAPLQPLSPGSFSPAQSRSPCRTVSPRFRSGRTLLLSEEDHPDGNRQTAGAPLA